MSEQSPGTDGPIHDYPFPREPAVELSAHMNYLREHEPIASVRLPSGQVVRLVTRYDDVKAVLSDARFSMEAATAEDSPELSPMVKRYPGLFSLDPPLHTQVRRLFTRALHAQPHGNVEHLVATHTAELARALRADGPPGDLISDFCEPLVTRVAADLLGVAPETVVAFRHHFAAMIALTGVSREEAVAQAEAISAIVGGVVDAKRAVPTDDVFGHIVAEFDADGTIPERNLIGLGASVLSSTANSPITQISYAVVTLLRHPDQWALLCRRPELLDQAVQECFRYSAPLEVEHLRIATSDVEVGGVLLPVGSAVLTSVAAANRDASKFTDAAVFDITRTDNRHVGFGFGPHVCAGSAVGTAMLGVVLAELTSGMPTLALAVPDEELFLHDEYSHALALGRAPITW